MLIPIGKSVGIVGASGAGKTTAVDIILGLLNPQSGEVFADGVPVMEHYTDWLAHIGYIPQMIFMLDDTGCFIKKQKLRVWVQCPGNPNPLALPAGKPYPALPDYRVKPFRQSPYKIS